MWNKTREFELTSEKIFKVTLWERNEGEPDTSIGIGELDLQDNFDHPDSTLEKKIELTKGMKDSQDVAPGHLNIKVTWNPVETDLDEEEESD